MMIYLLIKQSIKNFVVWKDSFDQFHEYRKIGGELSCEIYLTNGKRNEHIIVSQWKSEESALEFLESQSFEMIKELEEEPVSIQFLPKTEIANLKLDHQL
jgi:heme-degrading monooxygenase HmoA